MVLGRSLGGLDGSLGGLDGNLEDSAGAWGDRVGAWSDWVLVRWDDKMVTLFITKADINR